MFITQNTFKKPLLRSSLTIFGSFFFEFSFLKVGSIYALTRAFALMGHQLRAAFREVQQKERDLNIIIEHIPVGVAVFGTDGRVVLLNQFGRDLLLGDAARCPGGPNMEDAFRLYDVKGGRPCPPDELPFARALQGKTVETCDLEAVVGGLRIPLEIFAVPSHVEGQVHHVPRITYEYMQVSTAK